VIPELGWSLVVGVLVIVLVVWMIVRLVRR